MRRSFPALLLLAVLAGCSAPPPEAYTHTGAAQGEAIGRDAANEDCTQQRAGDGAVVFCGSYSSPAGRVVDAGPANAATLAAMAAAGPWRTGLDRRLACGAPTPTTILGGAPAYVLSCTRRNGGWPQVAMAALVRGHAWTADAIQPALPVLPRAIGVLSGEVAPDAAAALPPSGADALLASRLAATAFSAGDVGQYEQLMTAGTRANQSESFAAAELAYRAALAVQQKALGKDTAERAAPLLPLALQVSDQGRYAEADALFAEAERLVPATNNPLLAARLMHYRALHAYNQHHANEALPLLRQAEARYAALLPPEALHPHRVAGDTFALGSSGARQVNNPIPGPGALIEPAQQNAMIGLLESRRYRALALRDLGRSAESEAAIREATELALSQNMRQPALTARLLRTAAASAAARGDIGDASTGYLLSTNAFGQALPGSRPEAATRFLHAAELLRLDRSPAAIAECRAGAALLRQARTGIEEDLLQPCLGALVAAGGSNQAMLAEAFEMAQLAQGSITSQQIGQSAARLAEGAKNPKVGAAIRARQDAGERLATLERQRDIGDRPGVAPNLGRVPPAELDDRIADARTALAETDAALQTASPRFGQLIQDVAPVAAVQSALRPDEAFVSISMGHAGGWVFALRRDRIAAAPLAATPDRIAALVRTLRASVEIGASGLPAFNSASAQALYQATLAPVAESFADARALVVAPAGPLLSVPFNILLTGPAGPNLARAPWLIRRMSVAHVPAAANFIALRKIAGTSRASRPWFGMGGFRPITAAQARNTLPSPSCLADARALAGLPALPFSVPELELARKLTGASPQDELLDSNFNVARVRAAPLRDYRVLHFASHALLPAELKCIAEPAIVTSTPPGAKDASGALLTTSAIIGLDLDADTVILSACNSAGPQGPAGESLSGLARAFFFAGARSLLATHWSINDQATAYLVIETLKRAKAGSVPGVAVATTDGMADALRSAQLAVLDGAGSTLPAEIAHPFYWGAFALIGDGSAPINQRTAGL